MQSRADRFDDSVDIWFDKVRGHRSVDRIFYGASTVADHSIVWIILALLRRITDGDWYVSVRVLIAIPIESFLVNIVIKSLFRRTRPVHEGPRPFRLRVPRTSSFPSGHATSAFTSAVLLSAEASAAAAIAYFCLATLIAISRVYVRIHHASDVIGGILLGIIFGLIGRAILF